MSCSPPMPGQPQGEGRAAGVPGHPGTQGTGAPGDGEMLLGVVKERLNFST